MQQPTATGIKIRSTDDAHILFHAVAMNILPMIIRRLDPQERAELQPGNCYIWEERGSDAEATGMGIERWTDGKHWGPSRVRDDFLFYHQRAGGNNDADDPIKDAPAKRLKLGKRRRSQPPPGRSAIPSSASSSTSRISPPLNGLPATEGDRLVKQTYSVLTKKPGDPDTKPLRKWHLTAYFTTNLLDSLKTVHDIPQLASLESPPIGLYKTARVGKKRDNEYASTSAIYRSAPPEQDSPRSLAVLEPSTHPTPIYQNPPPLPARQAESHNHLGGPFPMAYNTRPMSHLPQLPHLSTILPGGDAAPISSSSTSSASYALYHPRHPADAISPHSAGPSREHFMSPSPQSSPAVSTHSAPNAPVTPPYETHDLPNVSAFSNPRPHFPISLTRHRASSSASNSASRFQDYRGLPPLDFASGPLPARGAEDERALWALTSKFNR